MFPCDGKTIMQRTPCILPRHIRSFCESGCIYRNPVYKHLACKLVPKQSPCVAPCVDVCPCTPSTQKPPPSTNEVPSLQETRRGRRQLSL